MLTRRSFFKALTSTAATAAGLAVFPIKWHYVDKIVGPKEAQAIDTMRKYQWTQYSVGFAVTPDDVKGMEDIVNARREQMERELEESFFGGPAPEPMRFGMRCDPEQWS